LKWVTLNSLDNYDIIDDTKAVLKLLIQKDFGKTEIGVLKSKFIVGEKGVTDSVTRLMLSIQGCHKTHFKPKGIPREQLQAFDWQLPLFQPVPGLLLPALIPQQQLRVLDRLQFHNCRF